MKKYYFLLLAATAIFSSCEKDPDLSKMDSDFTVYTQYDPEADFSTASTYFLPDSILTTGGGMQAVYWKDENAQTLIKLIESKMNTRNYSRESDKENAQLGIQVSYVENSTHVGGLWWNTGYWGPFWGGGWYYPYPVSYNYDTGTLVIEIVDLRDKETTDAKLPVIWRTTNSGMLYGNNQLNLLLVQRSIEQAFNQSTYINHKAE